MRRKFVTAVLILGASTALFVAMRRDNRADAAAGDCYSAVQGPSTPTVCN